MLQRAIDHSGVWRRTMAGCRTARRSDEAIARAGFAVEEIDRFSFRPTPLDTPVAPKVLGRVAAVSYSITVCAASAPPVSTCSA